MKKKKSKKIRTKFDFNNGRKIISMNDKNNFRDDGNNNHSVKKATLRWDTEMEKDRKITVIIIIIVRIRIGTVKIITIIIIITVIIVMLTIIIILVISTFIREILIKNIAKIIIINSNNDND